MPYYIDNYSSPGNPVVDITGTQLGILLNYQDKGAAAPQDHPLSQFQSLLGLPPNLVTLFQTPLNQMFDQFWSQNRDANGQTQLDRTKKLIADEVASHVREIGSEYSAYGIVAQLPATGILRAIVLDRKTIFLNYEIGRVRVEFKATFPFSGGLIPDPKYEVTFDFALLTRIIIPPVPGPFGLYAKPEVENAHVSVSNATAEVLNAVKTALEFLNDRPTDIFQVIEGQIDGTSGVVDLGALSAALSSLTVAWQQAASVGFAQLIAFIDQGQRTLSLRFVHPVDPAPDVRNAVQPGPNLILPLLGTSSSQVRAGDSLGVTGSNFPIGQLTTLSITWDDTTSGNVVLSEVQWEPAQSPTRTDSIPRSPFDNRNTFTATNLLGNTPYAFTVRDADLLTETPWSQPLNLTTQPTDLLDLVLDKDGLGQSIGNPTLTQSGSFTATVVVPSFLAPGT